MKDPYLTLPLPLELALYVPIYSMKIFGWFTSATILFTPDYNNERAHATINP